MSRKKNNHEEKEVESKDQLITELIQQRKLQQEALQKIMTSMEKEKEEQNGSFSNEPTRRKRTIEKIFSTDKKNNNK